MTHNDPDQAANGRSTIGDTEFDTMLRDALRIDADRAPEMSPEWSDTDLITDCRPRPQRSRRAGVLVGIAAAGVVLAGFAMVNGREQVVAEPAAVPSDWQPDGIEFPSTDLGPATDVPQGPVVADLTRHVGIEGHPPQIIATSLMYLSGETAEEVHCTWERGSGGCRTNGSLPTWSTGISSSVDNGVATTNLYFVEGLPANVAYLSYRTADQQLWQKPIVGFAAFPYYEESDPTVIGYDRDGTEIGRYDWASGGSRAPGVSVDLTDEQRSELSELTDRLLTTCLTDRAGTVSSGGVTSFDDSVDQQAVWRGCVQAVKQAVGERVAEID